MDFSKTHPPHSLSLSPTELNDTTDSSQILEHLKNLQEENLQLRYLLQMKNQLFAMGVHDFRSPLTSILLSIDTLTTLFPLDKEVVDTLNDLKALCMNQIQLIKTYLVKAQTESMTLIVDYSELNELEIRSFFKTIIKDIEIQAQHKKITLISEIPDSLSTIQIDVPKIRQVLINLLTNAIKFTPKKGKIHLSLAVSQEKITFGVTDTGIGIPKESLTHVFDYHTHTGAQTTGTEGEEGTGLGLSICKYLVELHHGEIAVKNNEPHGTRFYFTLPHPPKLR